jgi:hypothetical protein
MPVDNKGSGSVSLTRLLTPYRLSARNYIKCSSVVPGLRGMSCLVGRSTATSTTSCRNLAVGRGNSLLSGPAMHLRRQTV